MTAISSTYQTATGSRSLAAGRFEVLDSWRGICALLVAVYHFQASGFLPANRFLQGGYLFVDFFFVLSGFVIAHAYGSRMQDGAGFRRFLVLRFGRLFPLHLFMLAAFVGFEILRLEMPALNASGPAFEGAFSIKALVSNLFLLQGLGIEKGLTWNSPSWSISTEFFAYVLFAALTLVLRRNALLAFAAAIVVAPFFILSVSPDFMDTTWDFGFIRCVFGFSSGVLVNALFAGMGQAGEGDTQSTLAWTIAELATIVAVVVFVAQANAGPASVLAPYVFAFAVFVFAHEQGSISRLLTSGAALQLGALSYSIYMTHMFVLSRMINGSSLLDKLTGMTLLTPGAMSAWAGALATAALIVATLLASLFTYRFVEVPGRDLFRKLAKQHF